MKLSQILLEDETDELGAELQDAFEDELEDGDNKLNEFRNALTDIKKGATKNIEVSKINTNVVPESILAQVKEKGPEIKSLLDRGET
mgnify:CR=1 FL=1